MMKHEINRPCIVGIGEILWDVLPTGKQLGGAPTNFAFHAQSLGAEGIPVSAVGDDALGHEIINTVRDLNLEDTHISVMDKCPTGTVTVKLDSEGVPDFTIHDHVAWDYIPFSIDLKNLAPRADVVCYGSLAQRSDVSRDTIHAFIKGTDDGCLRIYDVNLRQSFYDAQILQDTMIVSDVMKLNDEELPIVGELCGMNGSEEEILQAFLVNFGLEMIALTKGKKGSRLFSLSEDSEMKAPSVNVADTVGAGDAFTAAVAVGLLNKHSIRTIHRNATNLSAYVCTQKGATPKLPESLLSELKESSHL